MTTEAFDDQHVRPEAYDTTSDPNFVAYYAAESQTPATHARFTRVRDRALELLADAGRRGPFDVVDIGCGAGTQAMLWGAEGHRVRGLDVNEPLIALARDRAAHAGVPVAFDVGTATALPYADASADVVLMPELLEHVVEWERCLEEAVRVLRPGGLFYLSTTNWLCPAQLEFNLPAYSWYPGPLKRWCERKAVTTHPHWVEHARYPAVNWFSYYSLARWLRARGLRTLDRFDVIARRPLSAPARVAIGTVRRLPPARLLAHMASLGTTVWAFREGDATPAVADARAAVQRASATGAGAARRPLKILYHHRTSARDGSAVHIDGLVGALRAQGHEVVVVAPPVAAARATPSAARLARLRRRLPRAVHELLELAYNVPESVRLARALRAHRPDVLYERSNLYMVSGALLAARQGVPRISEVNAPYFIERSRHGGIALPGLARWTEDFAWRHADAVIPVTQVLARIVQDAGVARDRVHVMGNGIDAQWLRSGAAEATGARDELGWHGRVVLGFTGFVREWNGLETAVDLLARPGNGHLALLIVGDGTARPAIEARASERRVRDRVHFTGVVERARVAWWVSAFDIALQPAANPYASPLKLFEYMALARAIVAPDQPNIREVLQHERNALLFAPGDPASFENAVRRLADDAPLRARLAQAAAATVRQRNLTWAHNARRVTELAQQLAAADRAFAAGTPRRPLSAR